MNHKRSHAATFLSEGFNGGEFELIFSRKKIAMQTKEKIVPFLSFHLNSVIQVSSGRWIYAGIADKPGGWISPTDIGEEGKFLQDIFPNRSFSNPSFLGITKISR